MHKFWSKLKFIVSSKNENCIFFGWREHWVSSGFSKSKHGNKSPKLSTLIRAVPTQHVYCKKNINFYQTLLYIETGALDRLEQHYSTLLSPAIDRSGLVWSPVYRFTHRLCLHVASADLTRTRTSPGAVRSRCCPLGSPLPSHFAFRCGALA